MYSRGRRDVGGNAVLLGSVAQRIFNVAHCPVLSVSPRARRALGADQKFAKILYPSDFSEYYWRLNALVPPEARTWCRSDALVSVGDPAQAIPQAAWEQNADLIVLSAHRAAGTFNVPLTTAYQVVAHAPCPVLRVRC